jgi:hypothetical protein
MDNIKDDITLFLVDVNDDYNNFKNKRGIRSVFNLYTRLSQNILLHLKAQING